MSVFTIIRRGRQAAKEQKTKKLEIEQKEVQKPPYRHVPTHAATDALAGAPNSWRQEDRPRILEENRRRSAMAASGLGMHTGIMTPVHVGLPRTNSSLSHVSYPSVYANPVVAMPRNYSYASIQSAGGWADRGGEVVYSPMEQNRQLLSTKGKEVERIVLVDSGRASRSSSKDDLEIKPVKRHYSSKRANAPDARSEMPHRLHPSRRVSDPPAPVTAQTSSYQPRSSYYPPSASYARPAFGRHSTAPMSSPGIPPVPTLPPLQIGAALSHPVASTSSQSFSNQLAFTPYTSTPVAAPTVIAQPMPGSGSNSGSSANSTPQMAAAMPSFADSIPDFAPIPRSITDPALPMSADYSIGAYKPRRLSRTPRFSESEIAPRSVPGAARPLVGAANTRSSIIPTSLPTDFDEANFSPAQGVLAPPVVVAPPTAMPPVPVFVPIAEPTVPTVPTKGNRLSKGPKQPKTETKKSRWSFRSSKQTAVAV